ncbi:MAG: hypothetical protein ACKVU4_04500 [Phycisphaerales bacterium]
MDEPRRRAWRDVVRLGLPLGVSIAVHGLLLLMLLGVAWTFGGAPRGTDLGPPVMIALPETPRPAITPADSGAEGGATSLGTPSDAAPPVLTGLGASAEPPPVLRSGVDEGPVPRLRPDAVQVGGATFAGLGTKRARSVVYVVDASGAMVTNFKWIKDELLKSVVALSPTQRFQVVLFRDRTGTGDTGTFEVFLPEGGEPRLLPASGGNKSAFARWIAGVEPAGRSNPLDGLRRGLALEPDVMFVLSRGIRRTGGGPGDEPSGGLWGHGAEAILAELDRLNPTLRDNGPRMVAIKTIQFLEEDPTGIMRAIAERHGDGEGSYRVVTLRDLGVR